MPLYRQSPNSAYCVPYGIKGVVEYFKLGKPTKQTLIKKCNAHVKYGTDIEDAEEVLWEYGLKLKKISLSMINIRKAIGSGNPIVISYKSGLNESHFSVICGYKKVKGTWFVILNDTWIGKYEMPLSILKVLSKADGEPYIKEISLQK